jgi:recombination protein RecA
MKEKKSKAQESNTLSELAKGECEKRDYGDLDSVVKGLEKYIATSTTQEFLHTGNLALDYAISMKIDGTGGYPFGTIVEIFGDPASGKSLLLAKAVAEAQRRGMPTIVMDAERRWNDKWTAENGVDVEKRKLFQPDTVEAFGVDAHQILSEVKKLGGKVVVVLDSVAILSTLKETEDADEGDFKMDQGRKAQKIRQVLRILKADIGETNSLLLAANHVIANPGTYSHQRITPGGGGFPFQSSVRIELLNPTVIKLEGKEHPIGNQLHAKVTKNSICPPFGTANIKLFWRRGVSKYSGLLDIMKDLDIITVSGGWYTWKEFKFQDKGFEEFINSHPEILKDEHWDHPYFME